MPYCHEEINSTNDNGSVYMTCGKTDTPNEYQIKFEGTSSHPLKSIDACSVGINDINGKPGGSTLTFDFDATGNGSAVATFTCDKTPNAPYVAYIVFGLAPGQLVLNEFPKDMDWTATCSDVPSKTPSELSINATEATLDATIPATFQIVATTAAEYDGTVTYTSDKAGVASVSESGLVTAVGRGTATITVTAPETGNYAASSQTLIVTVTGMKKKASGQGYGSMILQGVDLYDWNGQFPGSVQCGNVDLYIVTFGNKIIYKTVVNDGKTFESCTDYFCQIRTWKPDSTLMQEHCAMVCSNDLTTRYMTPDQVTRAPGISSYGNEMMLTSYMVLTGCGARTMEPVPYTRDYINNYDSSDETAPVLGAATVISGTDDVTISFDAVTSEEVFYMIEDAEHNKKYCSMVPEFVLPKDGSGITYNYSCYAIDFSGNKSAAQPAEVSMAFSVISNQALNRATYSEQNAVNMSSSKAVDGIIHESRFSSGSVSSPEKAWWAVDLGESYNISSIEMAWEGAYSKDFIIYGADTKPSEWNNIEDYEELYVNTDIVPIIADNSDANTKNNIYAVSGHARYLLFMPSSLANNAWGASFYEFRVFATSVYDPDAGEDTQNPVISEASLTSKTFNSAVIAITATDDKGVVKVHAADASKGYGQDLVPEAGSITLTGLEEETTYNITLTAYDAMNKASDPFILEAFATDTDPSVPHVAAPTPTHDGSLVKAIYSPTYSADCNFANWSNQASYVQHKYGKKYVVGAPGYFGVDNFHLDCTEMDTLHYDIWIADNASLRIVPICRNTADTGNEPEHGEYVNLKGQQWNSIDLALHDGEYAKTTNWTNVYQVKIDNAANLIFWVGNAYFYKHDDGSATAISNT